MPASNKLEAVNRLSAHAGGGREELGPGSKERKSVLITVAQFLGLPVIASSTDKPTLAATIADHLGQPWDDSCWSTGSTITLTGLNRLLEGLQSRPRAEALADQETVADEARRILGIISRTLPRELDGRRCVVEMRDAEYSKWRQTEWPGWYFEFCCIGPCIGELGGGPKKVLGTAFDYQRRYVWDFKSHRTDERGEAPLNDAAALDLQASSEGVGFVVLSGRAEFDPAFRDWFNGLKGRAVAAELGPGHEGTRSRPVKSAFFPQRVDAFFFDGHEQWDSAKAAGAIRPFNQGRQRSGASREPKYKLMMRLADAWRVAELQLR